jgi:glycosyltransferase involved in cell wall biosynthesis
MFRLDSGWIHCRASGKGWKVNGSIRVRLLRTLYPHLGTYSGLEQYVKFLDPKLCRIEIRVVPDSDAGLPLPFEWMRRPIRRYVQRHGMPWYKLSDLAAEIGSLLGCLARRTQILHFLDGEHTAQFLPVWLNAIPNSGTKTLATYHQPPELLESLIRKDVVRRLDCVHVLSPAQEDFFRQFLPSNRVKLVLHGINTEFFRPGARPLQSRPFVCMTTGHWLRDWSAIRSVVGALRAHPEIVFHLVTNRETGVEDEPNVTLHRNIDDASLLVLYQSANVMFLPMTLAVATNSLLEGIACGLPVVSTKLSAVEAYVPGNEAILIPNNDPGELADALLHLFRHPDECAMRGREARKRAEALDWRKIAREYEMVYSELAGKAP